MTTIPSAPTIAVLGLGAMGTAITRAAAAGGADVRAWNRSPRSLADLGIDDHGVRLAGSPVEAASGADIVVLCVRDHAAARTIVDTVAPHLGGGVVVNVSTASPAEAVESVRQAVVHGLRYVTGAVMVPTSMVGTDDCLVLYAGTEADLAAAATLRDLLGGTADATGPDHAVPPALDLAMLDIYFAGMYAHLHATALAEAHGIEPQRFLPYAQGVVSTLGGSLPGLTAAVERRTWDSGEARLDMCLAFLEHIVASSREVGIAPGLAVAVRDASARALARRPGSTDWDVVAEDFLPGVLAFSRPATHRQHHASR